MIAMTDKSQRIQGIPATADEWVGRYRNDWGFEPLRPADPTREKPGSPSRVEVMRERFQNGQPLFVQGDKTLENRLYVYAEPVPTKIHTGDTKAGCEFNGGDEGKERKYRYRRWSRWTRKPSIIAAFVGLSPDEAFDQRAVAWSMLNGFDACEILNIYATLDQSPYVDQIDPNGPLNDMTIRQVATNASCVICCWGQTDFGDWEEGSELQERSARVAWLIRKSKRQPKRVLCFGMSRIDGRDGHPNPIKFCSNEPVPMGKVLGESELNDEEEQESVGSAGD